MKNERTRKRNKKGFLKILINNNNKKMVVKQKSPQLIFVKQKIKFT
jgi:hypothetical protein